MPPTTVPIMDGYGHDELEPISTHSLSLTSSLDKTDSCSSHFIAEESKNPQPVFTHNDFYSPPGTKMTLLPAAYTSPLVSSLLTLLDLKHHWHHSYGFDTCPNGREFDDDIINNNTHTISHPFSLTTNSIENLITILLRNSYLISKQKLPRILLRMPQNLLSMMIPPDRKFDDDDSEIEHS